MFDIPLRFLRLLHYENLVFWMKACCFEILNHTSVWYSIAILKIVTLWKPCFLIKGGPVFDISLRFFRFLHYEKLVFWLKTAPTSVWYFIAILTLWKACFLYEGGPYEMFAGRDVTYALASFDLDGLTDEHTDIATLSPRERESVLDWEEQFTGELF